MTDLAQMLREAPSFEYRRNLLHEDISQKKEVFQHNNRGLVLDIEEHFGIKVGDKVRYVHHSGQERTGYLSHFFMKVFAVSEPIISDGPYFMMGQDGPTLNIDEGIRPVMFDSEGKGYSMHHGKGQPQRVE